MSLSGALRGLLVGLALAGAAAAEGPERRMLGAEAAAEFRGVGRLNVAGTRFCTATLISETVVVTAAHCLFHPRTGARVPLAEFRFVAGLRLGETAAVRGVARAVAHPAFAYGGAASPASVGADLALLELDAPVTPEEAPAFATGEPGGEGALSIVSYARDRAQAPSVAAPCAVVAGLGDALVLDCGVNHGASGAPVLQGEGGRQRLVAVVSAMSTLSGSGREVSLAARAGSRIGPMLGGLAAQPREE